MLPHTCTHSQITKNMHMQPYLYSQALAQYLIRPFLHLTGFSLQKENIQIILKH